MSRLASAVLLGVLMLPFLGTLTMLGPFLSYELDVNRLSGLVIGLLLFVCWRQALKMHYQCAWSGLLLLMVMLVAGLHALGDTSDPFGLSQSALYGAAIALGYYFAMRSDSWELQIRVYMGLKLLALMIAFVLCQQAAETLGRDLIPQPPVYLHARLLGMDLFYMMVLLLIGLALWRPTSSLQVAFISTASLMAGYFTVWFAPRGATVALILFLATVFAFLPGWRRAILLVIFAMLLGAVFCVLFGDADYLARRLNGNYENFNNITSGRWQIWKECYEWWVSSPSNLIFGAGPDAFRLEAWASRSNRAIQPHNVVVQVALEWGVLGLIVLAGLVMVLCRRVMDLLLYRSGPDWQRIAACSMPALMVYALVDGIFYHAVSVLPAAMLIGLLFRPLQLIDRNGEERKIEIAHA